MLRRIAVTGLVLASTAGGAAAPALADDASLAQTIRQWEKKSGPALRAFEKAGDVFERTERLADARTLRTATIRLRRTTRGYLAAVNDEEASTPEHAKAQKRFASALRRLGGGLGTFERAITQLLDGADDRTVKRTLEQSMRQIAMAQRTGRGSLRILLS